jgi:hypothetical protein
MPEESPTPKSNSRSPSPAPAPAARGSGSDPGPGRRPGGGAARAPAGRAALLRAAGFWLVFLFLRRSLPRGPAKQRHKQGRTADTQGQGR